MVSYLYKQQVQKQMPKNSQLYMKHDNALADESANLWKYSSLAMYKKDHS